VELLKKGDHHLGAAFDGDGVSYLIYLIFLFKIDVYREASLQNPGYC